MTSNSGKALSWSKFPDGLDEKAIDGLIAEVQREVVKAPAATSALLDGSAAERCRRRIRRRVFAGVVRALPVRVRRMDARTGEVA